MAKRETLRWGSTEHASVVRATVLLIWAIIVANTPYTAYSLFPKESIQGFGLGSVLLEWEPARTFLLSGPVLIGLQWLACLGCLVAVARPGLGRLFNVVLCMAVIVLDMLTKSVGGFANHAQTLGIFSLLVFAVVGNRPFLTPEQLLGLRGQPAKGVRDLDSSAHDDVMWLIAVLVVVPYTFIGVNRLLAGGVEMFSGDAIMAYLGASSRLFGSHPDWLNIPKLVWLLNAGFFITTLLEASSAGVLFFPRYRVVWLLSMSAFHVATLFLMNIFFWENLALSAVVFWWGWSGGPYQQTS